MKINKIIYWMLGLAAVATSCNVNELVDETELPEGAYVRLNFSSGAEAPAKGADTRAVWNDAQGTGNLTFNWESVDIDSEEASKMALIISDGSGPISSKAPSQNQSSTYSGLSVTPSEADAHYAHFRTVGYYSADDLKSAKYCFAVAGNPAVTADAEAKAHKCKFPEMPDMFSQDADQDPSYLREHMYMYASSPYSANGNALTFSHIPATFRFIVTNATSNNVSLQEVSMSFSDGSISDAAFSGSVEDWNDVEIGSGPVQMGLSVAKNIASSTATARFNWEDGTSSISFAGGYEKFGVATGGATTVPAGGKYTAYAMALPLSNNNAFKGETLNVNIKCAGVENIAFQVPGEKIASVNGSAIYNWIGGKSYTIRINIGFDGAVTGEILDGNVIRVTSDVAQSYTLMYEGADGEPLADYAAICTLPGEHTVEEYLDLIDVNVAPREAATIGIYDSEGVRNGTIHLAGLKVDYSEAPMYSFGLLSDVHIGRSGINADQDFANVLSFFESKGTSMTCICGDITQNGTEAEYIIYKSIVDASNSEVYTTTGNHDCTSGSQGVDASLWQKYTGRQLVFEETVEANGKVDHYLFLGMSYWNFNAAYLDCYIDWLEDKLEAYRNDRCFVFTHLFFPDRAGNMNEVYPSGNWLSGVQLYRLQEICDHYVNSVWFSGHSHWEWDLQRYEDKANIYRESQGLTPGSGWCVHVPSCGVPGISNTGTDRNETAGGSEGAIVEVYENHIDILGISLDTASGEYKYLPIATYRLDTSIQTIEETEIERESHYLKAEHFHQYKGDKSAFSVVDVEGTNYVDVIFTAKDQGFYVSNETFIEGVSNCVAVVLEDLTCWANWDESRGTGTEVNSIEKVGFYGGSYYLATTNSCYVNATNGVQFQTSKSSNESLYPIKLRMKVQMVFSKSSSAGSGGGTTESDYITADDFRQYKGEVGPHSVVQLEDNFVQVTFNNYSNGNPPGFFVANSTYTPDATGVNIIIEEVHTFDSNNIEVDVPAGVGFYCTGGKYSMNSTTSAIVNNHFPDNENKIFWGVQFQLSNSKYDGGPLPLTVKMKARMQYSSENGGEQGNSQYLRASDFSHNPNKNGDASVSKPKCFNVAGTDYVDVTFYAGSQGFWVKPTGLTDAVEKVNIVVEEAFVLSRDGKIGNVPAGFGFYAKKVKSDGTSEDYGYHLTTLTVLNNHTDGVAFQSKGSSVPLDKTWPMTIRMKVKMEFQ